MSIRTVHRRAGVRVGWVSGIALTLFATCVTAVADRQEIDLSQASVIDPRGDWGHHVIAQPSRAPLPEAIIDGDEETGWSSGRMDPEVLPPNLYVVLAEPTAIGAMEVLTQRDGDGRLRLTHFEVYGRMDDGWALLGEMRGGDEELLELELIPAEVRMLRVRLLGNDREDNQWSRIRNVRLFSPQAGVRLTALTATEVQGETVSEWYFEREAFGLREPLPRVSYDPEIGYLGYVTSFLDTMIEHGTDRYGEVHSPMFVGMLKLEDHEHPGGFLPSIPGQRWNDRPFWGGNLAHDRPLLEAMEYVSEYTGEAKYREAARAYLDFFVNNCTDTPTGLWPWGEHVYWDFYGDRYRQDNRNHEAEGASLFRFWEIAWEVNPRAVLGQASGLINHVHDLNTFAFNRHADIARVLPDPRPEELLRGTLDFQPHGGRYMRIWAFAWSKSGDETYYGWIERMADYWEDVRLEDSGMLPVLSQYAYRPALRPSPGGNLSCGIAMLESAELLEGTELAKRLRRQGMEYLDLVAAQASAPPEVVGFDSGYGGVSILSRQIGGRPITAFSGNATQMLAYRMTGDGRHLEAARQVAEAYAAIDEVPEYDHLRAGVFGQLIHMMLDMHAFDPDPRWLEAGERFAQAGIEGLYYDGLFRGATGQWIYDSHLYPSSFVHGLVRLHSVVEQEDTPAPPLYYHR